MCQNIKIFGPREILPNEIGIKKRKEIQLYFLMAKMYSSAHQCFNEEPGLMEVLSVLILNQLPQPLSTIH